MYKYVTQASNLDATRIDLDFGGFARVNSGADLATGNWSGFSSSSWTEWLRKRVYDSIKGRKGIIGNVLYGYDTYTQGNPPSVRVEDFRDKPDNTGNGSAWKKSAEQGTIVMGAYHNVRVSMRIKDGERVLSTSTVTPNYVEISKIISGTWIGNRFFVDVARGIFLPGGRCRWPLAEVTAENIPAAALGWDLTCEGLATRLVSSVIVKDDGLVTGAIAEANRGSIDLLTTAAELPETLKSVFDGIAMIGRASKAAKNREIQLSVGHKARVAKIRARTERQLQKINSKRLGASNYKKEVLRRQAENLMREQNRVIEKESKAFVDAVASVWMNYRYNIMPNVYTIDDALDTLANWYTDFVTTRSKLNAEIPLTIPEGFTGKSYMEAVQRVTLKRKYVLGDDVVGRMLQVGSANIAVTALELARLSFVLGWFINLGDVLSAYTAVPVHSDQKCAYAQKISHTESYSGPHGSEVTIVVNAYKREIIHPNDYIGLSFDPNITLFRAFDSAALLWPSIKSNLLTSKRKLK